MKLLFAAVITVSLMSTTHAQSMPTDCARVEALAKDIMEKRQINYDIMLLINSMNNELYDQPELITLMQSMIDMAYSEKIAVAADGRSQQVETFKAHWAQRCANNTQ